MKKIVCFALALALGLAILPFSGAGAVLASADTYSLGDVNGNGRIEIKDYSMIKRAVLKTITLTPAQQSAADVNGNERVDSKDYAMLKRHILRTYDIFGGGMTRAQLLKKLTADTDASGNRILRIFDMTDDREHYHAVFLQHSADDRPLFLFYGVVSDDVTIMLSLALDETDTFDYLVQIMNNEIYIMGYDIAKSSVTSDTAVLPYDDTNDEAGEYTEALVSIAANGTKIALYALSEFVSKEYNAKLSLLGFTSYNA